MKGAGIIKNDTLVVDRSLTPGQNAVVGLRTAHELRGIPCFSFQDFPDARKNILCSRSFGQKVTELPTLREAVASHAARAGEKLRQQGGVALGVTTYIRTSPFRLQDERYRASHYQSLPIGRSNTATLIKAATKNLEQIYYSGYRYAKAGVALSGVRPAYQVQYNLFTPATEVKSGPLMKTLDTLNQQYGKHTLQFGAMGVQKKWLMKSEHRLPAYTTQWSDLPRVKA